MYFAQRIKLLTSLFSFFIVTYVIIFIILFLIVIPTFFIPVVGPPLLFGAFILLVVFYYFVLKKMYDDYLQQLNKGTLSEFLYLMLCPNIIVFFYSLIHTDERFTMMTTLTY